MVFMNASYVVFFDPMEYPIDLMQVYLILGCCDVVIGICVYHIGYSIGIILNTSY